MLDHKQPIRWAGNIEKLAKKIAAHERKALKEPPPMMMKPKEMKRHHSMKMGRH